MNVCNLPGFLAPDECRRVVGYFSQLQTGVAHTANDIRHSRVSFLHPDTPEKQSFVDKVLNIVRQANDEVYRFDLDGGHEPLQLAEYGVGGEYGWHLDIGRGDSARRKLSATIQLSDPESYDGGDLEMWNTKSPSRAQGTIIIFPSYLPHRVLPVTRGVRHSVVVWAAGTKPYR